MCKIHSTETSNNVETAMAIWNDSLRIVAGVVGPILHFEEGLARRDRMRQITYRFTKEPATPKSSMGMRMASLWMEPRN